MVSSELAAHVGVGHAAPEFGHTDPPGLLLLGVNLATRCSVR
jgi:hypothetical protein